MLRKKEVLWFSEVFREVDLIVVVLLYRLVLYWRYLLVFPPPLLGICYLEALVINFLMGLQSQKVLQTIRLGRFWFFWIDDLEDAFLIHPERMSSCELTSKDWKSLSRANRRRLTFCVANLIKVFHFVFFGDQQRVPHRVIPFLTFISVQSSLEEGTWLGASFKQSLFAGLRHYYLKAVPAKRKHASLHITSEVHLKILYKKIWFDLIWC